nr:Eco57I restriction-modification methylase domain-containing protein [Marinifilum flexuosum]
MEVKKPGNDAEFLKEDNINRKALHELLLYYLRERIDHQNNNIKHLIVTNGYEWFLFKGEDFYNLYYKNNSLVKEYEAFRDGLKDSSKNELFYNEIAKKYIADTESVLPFVYLNFKRTKFDRLTDGHLNTLYKIFSDVHILGHSFGNDSNKLNKRFYNELLHIVGLEEKTIKSKKVIQRKKEGERDYGSLLENTIFTLEDKDHLRDIKSITQVEDKSFSAGLELCLTWINRILFLKLLESQLLAYHNGNNNYKFLNSDFIKGYDDLNNLFFSALAKKEEDRHDKYKDRFKYIPYLNSSLFELNTLEREAFEISSLTDDEIEVSGSTVLKDVNGKKLKGKLKTLDYFFKFLDAYDFATDGKEGIEDRTETKTLINASVLGLIFEKINGYKEGSFYTPAYITMYISRETIRRAVVEKFKQQENEQIEKFEDVVAYCNKFFKQQDSLRFNSIINSIRICDPAVGSGHFLVSALNEIIAIKSELGILCDQEGIPLRCDVQIENDELYISDSIGHLFEYSPEDADSCKIQKTLFHEKQSIIENCLFGVDINPNSVKICRLRLWIELLKNAYYTEEKNLQTLPNIDINIKCGNSLVSRFKLDDDLKAAFKGKDVKYNFNDYKDAVLEYKRTNDKNRKSEIIEIIDEVKNNFKSSLDKPFLDKCKKTEGDYINEKERLNNLEKFGEKIKAKEKKHLKDLKIKFEKATKEKEEIVNNAIYVNAFEWRFEFPEILDEEGKYLGFDVVVGNPPYIRQEDFKEIKKYLSKHFCVYNSLADLLTYFVELSSRILRSKGVFQFIISSKFARAKYGELLRDFLSKNTLLTHFIDFGGKKIFDEATVDAAIIGFINSLPEETSRFIYQEIQKKDNIQVDFKKFLKDNAILYRNNLLGSKAWSFESNQLLELVNKIEIIGTPLRDWDLNVNFGIKTGFNKAFVIDEEIKKQLITDDAKLANIVKPLLRGRDIQKYKSSEIERWLIGTFPSLKIDIKNYTSLEAYLKTFGKRIEQTGEKGARKKTSHKWYETQDNIAFWQDFEKPKLVWKRIGSILRFCYDDSGVYCLDSTCIATGEKVKFLCAVLNSKLCNKELFRTAPKTGTGDLIISVQALEPLCVPMPTEEQEQNILKVFEEILNLKKQNIQIDTSLLESQIDIMVYKLYQLNHNEVLIIDPEFQLTESEYNAFELENTVES